MKILFRKKRRKATRALIACALILTYYDQLDDEGKRDAQERFADNILTALEAIGTEREYAAAMQYITDRIMGDRDEAQ